MGESDIFAGLASVLPPQRILGSEAARRVYAHDAYTVDRSAPDVIVLPETTEEAQAVIRWCLAHQVPFTPRGAGTGLSGGAMAAKGGVILSTKRLNRILQIDIPNRRLHAQAGVANLKLSQAVAAEGFHFAPDPSSQSVSTLGGNIAENSGGPHTLKYGVTAPHILAMTWIDNAGEVRTWGTGVEGGPGPDLLSVLVGSEGTLGFVTEAWVKLTPLPARVETLLASFPSVVAATEAVAEIIAAGVIPAALEMMDRNILVAVQAAFGLEVPAGTEAMLLVECDGSPAAAQAEIEEVFAICQRYGAIELKLAANEAERKHLWTARKKGVGAMGRLAPTVVTHDGVIPRSKLPEMLTFVYEVAEAEGLGVANIFHAGDGNLHPCFYFDDREPGVVERVVRAGERILTKCIELGGSVSGEHGIGVEKVDFMSLMFSEADLALQGDVKRMFPTSEFANPCKVLPNQKGCVEHQRRWRGAAH